MGATVKATFVCVTVLVLIQSITAATKLPPLDVLKPGSCPQTFVKASQITVCVPAQCSQDGDCPKDLKCCPNICGSGMCTPPVTKPPPTTTTPPNVPKPGSCPQTFVKQTSTCMSAQCKQDSDCLRDLKCCSNICGPGMCMQPVTKPPPTTTTRKPGFCTSPINQLVCSTECRSDNDCRGNAKCCPTTCNGRVCSGPNSNTRTTKRTAVSTPKPGSCRLKITRFVTRPPAKSTACRALAQCNRDWDCLRNLKCCPNICWIATCLNPV